MQPTKFFDEYSAEQSASLLDGDTQDTELDQLLAEKLSDAEAAGFEAEFDPDEAEMMGAFQEDALTEYDAWESRLDMEGENND